ncbi:hypothetical protein [Brevibacillus dissolubilis]|uniref:hypothetical protein n=1 Tax=Brevibacillus dissolubilis TaxID=1844116 RepID=UPI0011176547|nr:hypothetical protein [Brevibacillus dissolubilis]
MIRNVRRPDAAWIKSYSGLSKADRSNIGQRQNPHEDSAVFNFKKIWDNLQKEHCTPAQAAHTAVSAGVKKLVLTHFLPGIDVEQVYQEASEVFRSGEVIVAHDLLEITV